VDDSRVTVGTIVGSPLSTPVPAKTAPEAGSREAPRLRRMRSLNLSLVLIGATALGGLAGCGNLESGASNSRDVYANLEACKADWGTPGDCEEVESTRSATGTRAYYGPRYSSRSGTYGYNSTPRTGSRSVGSVSSSASRGGFGASASRHSSGSGSHASSGG
jgi:uncharacterized protein YgiB involved in biofilm formation